MSSNFHPLPERSDKVYLTDGGIETCLIFHEGIELREFAAFELLNSAEGRTHLKDYFRRYVGIARDAGSGFVFESPTWRASQDWGDRLGYSASEIDQLNRAAIALMHELKAEEAQSMATIVSGCVGPRGDGYNPESLLTGDEAEAYHLAQITSFAAAGADVVTAVTMTHAGEATGITRAAASAGVPAVVSFTVETDGRLPTG